MLSEIQKIIDRNLPLLPKFRRKEVAQEIEALIGPTEQALQARIDELEEYINALYNDYAEEGGFNVGGLIKQAHTALKEADNE